MVADHSELRAKLRGELIQPSDAGYDEARRLYNAMIDKKPRLIARCIDAADVIACVDYARENRILLAVRGGGHNGPGLGSCNDGLVVDLSHMRGVRVNARAGTAQVAGGCVWGDVDHATHAFGLAAASGIVSTTGVGGLTLGGGIGHLSRMCGLTIDNLVDVDLVLADGNQVTASHRQHEDLFWAVRGGGGNFGVATSFTFRLHPIRNVIAGPMFWQIEDAAEVMMKYQQFIMDAPEEINGFFAFLKVPPVPVFPQELHMRTVCGVMWCSTADARKTEQLLKSTEQWPIPLFAGLGSMPFPTLQSFFDGLCPPGLQWYWKGDFVDNLSAEAIARHVKRGSELPSMLSTMHLYPINGVVHRTRSDETAFSYRNSRWAEAIVGADADPANKEKIVDWARNYWESLHPYSAGGSYVNFMMEEGAARIEATYGANYSRLRQIKAKYDPGNLFCVNQNVPPSAAAAPASSRGPDAI